MGTKKEIKTPNLDLMTQDVGKVLEMHGYAKGPRSLARQSALCAVSAAQISQTTQEEFSIDGVALRALVGYKGLINKYPDAIPPEQKEHITQAARYVAEGLRKVLDVRIGDRGKAELFVKDKYLQTAKQLEKTSSKITVG